MEKYQHLSEGGLRDILNFSPMPTLLRDNDDRIVFWNYAAERIYGYSVAQARGAVWYNLLKTVFPQAHAAVKLAFEREGVWKGELVNQAKNKAIVVTKSHWMKLGAKTAEASNLIIQIDVDITHEKYDREILRSLDLAFKASSMVNWVWDFSTNKISWFGDTLPIFGRDTSGLDTYEKWERHIAPEDVPRVREGVAYYTHTKELYEREFRYRWPDESVHWILGRGRVYYHPNGAPSSMMGMNFEITERKKAEQRLMEARLAAEQASKAKSLFIAHMSHEMRTPLTAIMGYAEILRGEELTHDDTTKIGDIIYKNGRNLLESIDNVLRLALVQTDATIRKQLIDLDPLISSVLDEVKPVAASKGLELSYHAGANVPKQITTDPDYLRQILLNVINNALKFTARGFVKISTEGGEEPLRSVRFLIEDTGKGITAAKREKIFEPFEQEEDGFARSYPGVGLGLAISRNLARMLGGDLELVRSDSRGSAFLLTITSAILTESH